MKEKLTKIKPLYELHLSNGKRVLAIILWALAILAIALSAVGGNTSELSFLIPILFPIAILIFCKEHIEFALIPTFFNVIKSLLHLNFVAHISTIVGYIGTVVSAALIVVIIISMYKNINHSLLKVLAIASIVITLARVVIYVVTVPQFELVTMSTVVRLICSGFAWFIVYFSIKKEEFTSINITKIIIAVLVVAVAYFALTGILGKNNVFDSSTSCNHPECKENGPFPCYGKNNTCTNTTNCYQDLYCDECEKSN